MKKEDLTLKYLYECFTYDKENGELYWKERPRSHFKTVPSMRNINKKCARRLAGRNDRSHRAVNVNNIELKVEDIVFMFETGNFPSNRIEHINKNSSDTRFCNLKLTELESGTKGVCKRGVKFRAMYAGKYLGTYNTAEEAHKAYLDAKSNSL
jgi:hypothetical protein